ncbi:hypothetical protein E6C67_14440 [Azospirillum sp. TSA2s]|uniref:hypothetical protein n=1 Tax=Azospirillum sp. TSA2s TaxID=709810 RepID=UPI0010AB1AB3|nr:hypothetical protein [Azospirillum sp. TSA2s]QCG95025.1 hypothetical protein E6C67_14440 [Azospirillum sp. TSA2s]
MTAATPTPEELAVKLTDVNEIAMFYDPSDAVGLALDAATMIRTQVRQIEALRAEIERLTKERDSFETKYLSEEGRAGDAEGDVFALREDCSAALARATTAEAALAASLERERGMREALTGLADVMEGDCGVEPCIGSMAPAEHYLGLARAALQPQETADER